MKPRKIIKRYTARRKQKDFDIFVRALFKNIPNPLVSLLDGIAIKKKELK